MADDVTPPVEQMPSRKRREGFDMDAFIAAVNAQLIKDNDVVSIPGPQGEEGPMGPEGPPGEPGVSAWQIWIDNGGSGDARAFLNALTGPMGPEGPEGPAGPRGADGLDGTSVKGDTGTTGSIGPKGDTGNQGIQGIQGVKGDTGATGSTGATGTKGDPASVYFNGASKTGIKMATGQVLTDSSGKFTVDLTAIGFTTVYTAVATVVASDATAAGAGMSSIQTLTTTSLVGTVIKANAISILGVLAVTLIEAGRKVNYIVIGS